MISIYKKINNKCLTGAPSTNEVKQPQMPSNAYIKSKRNLPKLPVEGKELDL